MVSIKCLADICLIPIGTASPSISDYVVAVEELVRESHLKSTMHSAGTTIEGPWSEVMDLVGRMHELVHSMGVFRVQSDIRVGTRTDKAQTAADKVEVVERKILERRNK